MTRFAVSFALALAACGSPANYDQPAPDLSAPAAPIRHTRLSVGPDGEITDELLNGEPCDWMLDSECVKRCFPIEPMWRACDGLGGQYLYTRQGLRTYQTFGRIDTPSNSACGGRRTTWLLRVEALTPFAQKHLYMPQDCDGHGYDFTMNAADRQWYRYEDANVLAATVEDLPTK